MKERVVRSSILLVVLMLTLRVGGEVCLQHSNIVLNTDVPSSFEEAPRGCTVITVVKDGQVFFGGNDDYINLDSYYWVDARSGENYGVVWIGYPDNVQQGVNEKGLAYDANGLPRVDTNPHDERTHVVGDYTLNQR